jgi:hypothetical protein
VVCVRRQPRRQARTGQDGRSRLVPPLAPAAVSGEGVWLVDVPARWDRKSAFDRRQGIRSISVKTTAHPGLGRRRASKVALRAPTSNGQAGIPKVGVLFREDGPEARRRAADRRPPPTRPGVTEIAAQRGPPADLRDALPHDPDEVNDHTEETGDDLGRLTASADGRRPEAALAAIAHLSQEDAAEVREQADERAGASGHASRTCNVAR